jgi:hypothetical protein
VPPWGFYLDNVTFRSRWRMFVTQTLHSRFARARAIDQVLDQRFGRVLNGPPALRRPRGHLCRPTSQPVSGPWAVVPRVGSARIKADAAAGPTSPQSPDPAAAHGTGAGGTGDAAEKMCFIFPIRLPPIAIACLRAEELIESVE